MVKIQYFVQFQVNNLSHTAVITIIIIIITGGFSLDSEWQQVSYDLQNTSKYPSWFSQSCGEDGLVSSTDLQFNQVSTTINIIVILFREFFSSLERSRFFSLCFIFTLLSAFDSRLRKTMCISVFYKLFRKKDGWRRKNQNCAIVNSVIIILVRRKDGNFLFFTFYKIVWPNNLHKNRF